MPVLYIANVASASCATSASIAAEIVNERAPGRASSRTNCSSAGGSCYHASCTCTMGTHPMSVVDNELRVRGLDGLRVIDAWVMPAVTSANTNASTIMIAEKGAAMIAARQKLAA